MSAHQVINHYKDHPSIKLINDHANTNQQINFTHISQTLTEKKLKLLQTNKASGYFPQVLKVGSHRLSHSLTPNINNSITSCIFPDHNKRAEISPLFKKCDRLSKENYWPLSILTSTSKLFEGIMCDQLIEFISSTDLSAYRKAYSCNNVLVKCIGDWRKALDENRHVSCILIDLSKAFDSLPHGLLIAKLHTYGIFLDACSFIMNYLKSRNQTVKVGNFRSEWSQHRTGVPQGSLLGLLLFNIFINDLFYILDGENCLYNYARTV